MSENIEIKEMDKKKDNKKIVIIIVGSVLAFFLVFGAPIGCFVCAVGMGATSLAEPEEYKLACQTAELAVQNVRVGRTCPIESKVVYSNDHYIVVAVKYFPFSEETYQLTFVECYGGGEYWNSMIDVNGIDYDNIPQEIIDELKLRWELK